MGVKGQMEKLDALTKHKVKQFIKQLETHRGRGTELVSVYVPAGYELSSIIGQLQDEQSTAENIKSKQTRTNVIGALERMIQHLKSIKRTPPNGLAVFSGNVAEKEGQSDVEVWSVEMPIQSSQRLYRCDKEFILHPLREIVEHENVYGLVVLDRRDAMIGLLQGKKVVPLVQTHSEVPGKHKSGGQCVTQNTIVQTASGNILSMKDTHNPLHVTGVSTRKKINASPILDKWEVKKDEVYTIITTSPRLVLECSKDHVLFCRKEKIEEVPADQLQVGEYLIMPEYIESVGKIQSLQKKDFVSYHVSEKGRILLKDRRNEQGISQKALAQKTCLAQTTISAFERGILDLSENVLQRITKALSLDWRSIERYLVKKREIILPETVTADVAQIAGYYLGDGCREKDRLTFFEQRKDVAEYYTRKLKKLFRSTVSLTFRKSKNYYQIRVYGSPIVKLFDDNFSEILRSNDSLLPKKILESPLAIVASFIRGLFDAEGYISRGRIGIGMNNKSVIHALQMLLLRCGIISSFLEYDNRRNPYSNKMRYSLDISDKESLSLFKKYVGFTAKDKTKKLTKAIKLKDGRNRMRQLLTSGKGVRAIIEKAGYNLERFPTVTNFFRNERQMSKNVFKRAILSHVHDTVLKKKLTALVETPLLPVKIKEIKKTKKTVDMIDIATSHQNFIANCLLVHNSAVRFERLREGATVEHFKKIADYMKDQFLPMGQDLKGIILGGPGVTINKFMQHDYVTGDVKKKIIGTKDLSYTGEFGLQELLEKSEDLLAGEEVAQEKKIMQHFFHELSKDTGKAAYGKDDVLKCIGYGAVDTVLLSDKLDEGMVDLLEQEADKMGSKAQIISDQTREGVQLKEMGGIAAILRYSMG